MITDILGNTILEGDVMLYSTAVDPSLNLAVYMATFTTKPTIYGYTKVAVRAFTGRVNTIPDKHPARFVRIPDEAYNNPKVQGLLKGYKEYLAR